jgi:hypothetical protein
LSMRLGSVLSNFFGIFFIRKSGWRFRPFSAVGARRPGRVLRAPGASTRKRGMTLKGETLRENCPWFKVDSTARINQQR